MTLSTERATKQAPGKAGGQGGSKAAGQLAETTAEQRSEPVSVPLEPLVFGYVIAAPNQQTALRWQDIRAGLQKSPYQDHAQAPEHGPEHGQEHGQEHGPAYDPNQSQEHWQWVHLNRESPEARDWLQAVVGAADVIDTALFQPDSRPRISRYDNQYLINLRGINALAAVDDMVSIRLWATPNLLVTTSARRVVAVEDLRDAIENGLGPFSSGAAVALIAERLVARIAPVVETLQDQLDTIEEHILHQSDKRDTTSLVLFRRAVLQLRRYLSPQRDALAELHNDRGWLFSDDTRHQLHDTLDGLTRLNEDLDLVRERAMLLQEQRLIERADATNDRLFILALFSAVFLPLSIITGLFGVNIGGMPGVESPVAFAVLCGALVVIAAGIVWAFRRMKWI